MENTIQYKKTGLPWCPEIPEHWDVKKLKFIFKYQKGRNPSDLNFENEGEPYLSMDYLRGNPKEVFYVSDFNNFTNVEVDEILLLWDGSNAGEFIKSKKGVLSSTMAVLKIEQLESGFAWHFLKSIERNLKETTIGMGIPHVNGDALKSQSVFIPPLCEQQKIATYLDTKTTQIDNIVLKKQKLIACLKEERTAIINQAVTKGIDPNVKLKPSGIEWLGDIPEHWEVKRVKHISKVFGRIGYRGYQTTDLVLEGEGAITLSPSNMKELGINFSKCTYLSWVKYYESPEIQIENGDILFVKTGSTFGKTSFVNNLPEKATINPQLLVFKNINLNPKLLYFELLSEMVQYQVYTSVIGGTIPTISQEKIGNYYILVTPIKEQNEVVNFIEIETQKIDNTINTIEREIDLIKEYKTALINEVVTGKIILN